VIPKVKDARTMNKFRPISLFNCSYKIFTKVLTNRVGGVMNRLISSNQTAFIKGRYTLESVVFVHEVLHSVHCSKQPGMVPKLDYEMAYEIGSFCWTFYERGGLGADGWDGSNVCCIEGL
jgi:hypothetical protein